MPAETAKDVATDFCCIANSIYGLYIDVVMAIGNLGKSWADRHIKHLKELEASGAPKTSEAVNPLFVYSAQSGGEIKPVHQTTLVALIDRNRLGGPHIQFLGQMCIVALYQYWEDDFRKRLATALGNKKCEVKHDTFGELNYIRRSIIHRGGKAMKECAKATTLPQFTPGAEIVLDQATFDQIISAVRKAALQLAGEV